MAFRTNKVPVLQEKSASGAVATFNTALALPLKSCVVNIPVIQEGTGDPSPDNVRNFIGISSLDFTANSVVKTFQFGQTIYAGKLDVLTGIFTATHKLVTFDGSEVWNTNGDRGVYLMLNTIPVSIDSRVNPRAEIYNTVSVGTAPVDDGCINFNFPLTAIQIHDERAMTGPLFKQMLAENNIRILFKLAEPEVINLGGMNISTLQGNNNIFCDTGDTSVTYKDLDIAKRGNFREVFKLPS